MNNVCLCTGNYAKNPFYLKFSDISLYSIEELCSANWGTDAPDKENQPWHNADRPLDSQGLMSPGQLCCQGGRRRSKKGKNKTKQGQRLLLVR